MGAIEELINKADDGMLVCRIDRHSYDRRMSSVEMEGRVFVWTRVCGRCAVRRIQRIRSNGTIVNNSYVYPHNWPKVKGGALDREELGMIRLIVIGKGLA